MKAMKKIFVIIQKKKAQNVCSLKYLQYICINKNNNNAPGVSRQLLKLKAMKNSNNNSDRIVVAFHIGRRGKTFLGEKDFQELINDRLDSLFLHDRDSKGRFCKPYYADASGSVMVEPGEMNREVGTLDFDGLYDTDVACYLDECDDDELRIIARDDAFVSNEVFEYVTERLDD